MSMSIHRNIPNKKYPVTGSAPGKVAFARRRQLGRRESGLGESSHHPGCRVKYTTLFALQQSIALLLISPNIQDKCLSTIYILYYIIDYVIYLRKYC